MGWEDSKHVVVVVVVVCVQTRYMYHVCVCICIYHDTLHVYVTMCFFAHNNTFSPPYLQQARCGTQCLA